MLLNAAKTGLFDVRDKVGQMFYRDHYKGSSKLLNYQSMSMPERKKYRASWSKEKFAYVLASKSYEESWQEVDATTGIWMTLGSLIESYGGWNWPPAVEGGKLHFAKACRMGGQWTWRDSWSGLLHIKKLEHQERHLMDKSWKKLTLWTNSGNEGCQEESQGMKDIQPDWQTEDDGKTGAGNDDESGGGKSGGGSSSGAGGGKPGGGKSDGKTGGRKSGGGGSSGDGGKKPGGKGGGGGSGGGTSSGGGNSDGKAGGGKSGGGTSTGAGGKKPANQMAAALQEAMKVKVEICNTLAAADRVIRRIKSGAEEFDFANTEKGLGKLQKKWDAFDAVLTNFDKEFLIQDAKTKTRVPHPGCEEFIAALRAFALKEAEAQELANVTDIIAEQCKAQRIRKKR